MIVLDMKTVMFANVIVNFVGMVVMFIRWFQNRNKYSGLAYWVLDWVLLTGGTLLITLQGTIPSWESMILSNSMIVGGTLILYFGLCRFAGKKNNRILISIVLVLFAVFIAVHTYFVYGHNELLARSCNAAAGLLLACLMGMWLMFKGVSPQIRRISKGTGLGLSLSRSIILEHNGKMNVESEYGHGATFIVELPIVEALPSEVETTIPVIKEEKAITNKGRILVVDDEPGVRALLDSVLKKVGYSVDTIGDSKAAMDIIDAGTIYNVILLDIRMPGISGIELYTLATRKMPSLKSKIIFITGDVMGLDIKTFLNQNNLPYLSKPFDIELLKGKIKTVLKAGQLGNDSSSGTVA